MMFLDCEFDGHGGKLISMAIVTSTHDEFYEVLPVGADDKWVKENVMPVLNKEPIKDNEKFREKLHNFLLRNPGKLIVADSPADFIYLLQECHHMTEDKKYYYLNLKLDMQFNPGIRVIKSEIPHNALEDARALLKSSKYIRQLPS